MPRRGENIYRRKDGRWEGRYKKGYLHGKIKYGYVYAGTYKEVKEKLALCKVGKGISALESNLESVMGKKSEDSGMFSSILFETIAKDWIVFKKTQLKASSVARYNTILQSYLLPEFALFSMKDIHITDVADLTQRLLTCGGKSGVGLSPKTVTDILSVLKNIFQFAAQIGQEPIADIRDFTVKHSQTPPTVLSYEEKGKLRDYLCAHLTLNNLGILVCLYMGLRIGEICALKWEDIYFEEQCICVQKTMQRIPNTANENLKNTAAGNTKTTIAISHPKSNCSVRVIPIPDELFKLMKKLRCQPQTYFLTGSAENYIEPRTMQNRFKHICESCQIRTVNFHVLRHTFATHCVEMGFELKSLSEILGHANVNITLNRYVHPSIEMKRKNMNLFLDSFIVK